jgi:hypothetical protein
LGTNLNNQNSIQQEITSSLKSGNACFHAVQNLASSSLLYKIFKIKIQRTIILPLVLYVCETWSLTFRGDRRLKLFENSVENIWAQEGRGNEGVEKTTLLGAYPILFG